MNPSIWRRIAVMIAGILIMGPGVALIKLSSMGNDPSTAMCIAVGARLNIDFGLIIIAMQCICFVVEGLFGRKLIGAGTFVNWLFVGPLASGCERIARSLWAVPEAFFPRLLLMVAGVLVLSLACALYQTADVGVAPYDALSIILSEKSGQKYWKCRACSDVFCVLVTILLRGFFGVGTLICAAGLGPFIAFFTRTAARPLVYGPSADT